MERASPEGQRNYLLKCSTQSSVNACWQSQTLRLQYSTFPGTKIMKGSVGSSSKPDLAFRGFRTKPQSWRIRIDFATPSTEKQADGFSHLLHSVLRLGSSQWNLVVAGDTAAPWLVPDGTSQAPNLMYTHQIWAPRRWYYKLAPLPSPRTIEELKQAWLTSLAPFLNISSTQS